MELDEIMALLKANTAVTPRRFYKYVAEKKTGACAKCLRLAGEIFSKNDPNIPQLPLHPNCNCKLIEVDQAEYQKQQEFKFGNMSHEEWDNQSDDKSIYGATDSENISEKLLTNIHNNTTFQSNYLLRLLPMKCLIGSFPMVPGWMV